MAEAMERRRLWTYGANPWRVPYEVDAIPADAEGFGPGRMWSVPSEDEFTFLLGHHVFETESEAADAMRREIDGEIARLTRVRNSV